MTTGKRRLLLLGLMLGAGIASAQTDYPDKSKQVRMILPFATGTSTDVLGRALAPGMADVAELDAVVDNKPGGEAVIGAQAAKLSAPDGYNLFFTTVSTQALAPHMNARLPYDPIKDFIPQSGVAKTTLMVNMGPSTASFKTMREFFAAARANPGKCTMGTASPFTRLTAEVFQRAAGIQMLVVPHKNFSDALTGVASGQLDMVIVDSATAGPFHANKVRPFATTGATRLLRSRTFPPCARKGWPTSNSSVGSPPPFPPRRRRPRSRR
jgi:tripartite-type tricarboxylate transporter receptor subunit TctC